jgi:hypothetical protein
MSPRASQMLLATLLVVLLGGCSSASVLAAPTRPGFSSVSVPAPTSTPSRTPKLRRSPSTSPHPTHTPPASHPNGVPRADLPNLRLTPGVAFNVSVSSICVPGYSSSVRDVSEAEKTQVYARYGVRWVPYRHEVDHLISLELGGSNAIGNLWPEPYAGRWGARTKEVLENRLHDLVCARQLSLRSAQRQEAGDWVAAYRRYVDAPPRSGGSGGGSSPGGYYASSYPTASTIYCADDAGWRELSRTYLVHFQTYAQARARFTSYHLHQPC